MICIAELVRMQGALGHDRDCTTSAIAGQGDSMNPLSGSSVNARTGVLELLNGHVIDVPGDRHQHGNLTNNLLDG